jgi:hypothetical protein
MKLYRSYLIHDYIKYILKIKKNDKRYKSKVNEIRNDIYDICSLHELSKHDNIDIILAWNIYDNGYINSDRVMRYVLNFEKVPQVPRKYDKIIKKKIKKKVTKEEIIKNYDREDKNIKFKLDITFNERFLDKNNIK